MTWRTTKKKILSSGLDNVCEGRPSQKSLYISYYATDFSQPITKMMQLGLTTKASHQLNLKVYVKISFHKEYYLSYYQTDLNKIFFSNDDTANGVIAFMCIGTHFCTVDNCLLCKDDPRNLAIYLRVTPLVNNVTLRLREAVDGITLMLRC